MNDLLIYLLIIALVYYFFWLSQPKISPELQHQLTELENTTQNQAQTITDLQTELNQAQLLVTSLIRQVQQFATTLK
jgi:uncharacterized coiled-coil protein SlyX